MSVWMKPPSSPQDMRMDNGKLIIDNYQLPTLLFLLLFLLTPSPPPVVDVGAQQIVHTTHPIVAVHTRLADEVEEWKVKRTLELVREMGAVSIVEFFPWAYYEREKGVYDWTHTDMVMRHARAQGLTVIARMGLTPDWARPPDSPLTYLAPDAYADYATFTAVFAQRYQDDVAAIIIGNEPNLSYEWGYRQTTAADYVALLAAVFPQVKAVAPDVLLLGGALAPTLEPAGSPNGTNDLLYLRELYEAGGMAYWDGLAVHSYGRTFPPDADPAPDVINFRRVELLRDIMVEFGDADTPIFITEMGWNDHPRWTQAVRPSARMQYTLDAFTLAEGWDFVEITAVWQFRTPAPTKSYMDYYTLVTPEFVNKPIYEAIKGYTGN